MCLCVCVYKCVILEISSSPKVPLLVCTKPLANGYFWDVSQKLQVRVVHEKIYPIITGLVHDYYPLRKWDAHVQPSPARIKTFWSSTTSRDSQYYPNTNHKYFGVKSAAPTHQILHKPLRLWLLERQSLSRGDQPVELCFGVDFQVVLSNMFSLWIAMGCSLGSVAKKISWMIRKKSTYLCLGNVREWSTG